MKILWISDMYSPDSNKARKEFRRYLGTLGSLSINNITTWIKSFEELENIINTETFKTAEYIFICHNLDDQHREILSKQAYQNTNFNKKTGLDCLKLIYTNQKEDIFKKNIIPVEDNIIGYGLMDIYIKQFIRDLKKSRDKEAIKEAKDLSFGLRNSFEDVHVYIENEPRSSLQESNFFRD